MTPSLFQVANLEVVSLVIIGHCTEAVVRLDMPPRCRAGSTRDIGIAAEAKDGLGKAAIVSRFDQGAGPTVDDDLRHSSDSRRHHRHSRYSRFKDRQWHPLRSARQRKRGQKLVVRLRVRLVADKMDISQAQRCCQFLQFAAKWSFADQDQVGFGNGRLNYSEST